jgi:hypothetical protein
VRPAATGFQQRFDAVAKIADGIDAGHACATLQGVQVTLQAGQHLAVLRRIAQLADQAIAVVEQVLAFLDEDVDQFAVVHAEVERIGAVRGVRPTGGFIVERRTRHGVGRGRFGIGVAVPWPGASSSSKKRTGSAVACGFGGALLIHRRRGRLIGALSFTDRRLPADVRILGKGFRLARREFAGLEAEHGPLPVVVQGLLFVDHVQAGLERGCQRDRFCKTRRSHFILQARQLAVEWQCSSVVNDAVIATARIKRTTAYSGRSRQLPQAPALFRVAVIHRQRTGVEVRRQIVRHGQISVVDRRDRGHGICFACDIRRTLDRLDRFNRAGVRHGRFTFARHRRPAGVEVTRKIVAGGQLAHVQAAVGRDVQRLRVGCSWNRFQRIFGKRLRLGNEIGRHIESGRMLVSSSVSSPASGASASDACSASGASSMPSSSSSSSPTIGQRASGSSPASACRRCTSASCVMRGCSACSASMVAVIACAVASSAATPSSPGTTSAASARLM